MVLVYAYDGPFTFAYDAESNRASKSNRPPEPCGLGWLTFFEFAPPGTVDSFAVGRLSAFALTEGPHRLEGSGFHAQANDARSFSPAGARRQTSFRYAWTSKSLHTALLKIVIKFAAGSPAACEPLNNQLLRPVGKRFINFLQSLLSIGIRASSIKRQSDSQ